MHFEKATNIKCNTYGHNTIQTQEQNWEYVRKKIREDIRKGDIYNNHS